MDPSAGLGVPEADSYTTERLVCRHFTDGKKHPFDGVTWEVRDARAGSFFQSAVEVPDFWTDDSIGVVAKLYFVTVDGVRETSVRQMIHRVVGKITLEGIEQGHFDSRVLRRGLGWAPHETMAYVNGLLTDDPARIFYEELCHICLHQIAGFNTPTWLNIGAVGRKQCGHACYPLSIKDHMLGEDGIVDWWRKEAIIFKSGGGAGINLSNLRGSMEALSSGGVASGPLPYMRAANAGAETLKSGGVHRRAAKFVCLDDDHPDIEDFIWCKVREDEVMSSLMKSGHDLSIFSPEGERNVAEVTSFQSANNSVCITDAFMRAVENDEDWNLIARTTGDVVKTVMACDLLKMIAEAAWRCADPGVMFIDTINRAHTTPSLGPVSTVNTCGEISQNDDTACNLAALNVLKFLDLDGFKINGFNHVVDVMMTAQDIVNGFSELPTERIQQNTRDLRQCGLGFTNLGAAIMAQGLPYDSDEGRDFAASVTALLTGRAYAHSARMAKKIGAFRHFKDNRGVMLRILMEQMNAIPRDRGGIWQEAECEWTDAISIGQQYGYRNSLATAMMPTGTVSFLLGADTTGVEPPLALVTHKKLAAAGEMIMVNRSAHMAAAVLGGYSEANIKQMSEGDFSSISPEDLPVFATAMGQNSIAPMGHLRMVVAIQPFVSQAISKTTNLPNEATVEDIYDLYLQAWKSGVKVLSVYRDGSKATQVLTSMDKKKEEDVITELSDPLDDGAIDDYVVDRRSSIDEVIVRDVEPRNRMPRTRKSITHKIHVRSTMGEHEGYVTAGMYPDGRLGEMFIEGFGKQGSFTQNALAAWATDFSISLQYGVPMEVLCGKHAWVSDETGGIVVPPSDGTRMVITKCSSIVDYIARWLIAEFGSVDLQEQMGVMTDAVKTRKMRDNGLGVDFEEVETPVVFKRDVSAMSVSNGNGHGRSMSDISGPPCSDCGSTMYRAGACWQCRCGNHTGCG